MSRDVRWCHTINAHATHEYGPGILCPGVTPEYEQRLLNAAIRINQEVEQYRPRFTVENLAEPVDSIRQYWTEGDGAKPLDPIQRLLDAQRRLREARTDAERLRAMRECEEAVAAKDVAARADLNEANIRTVRFNKHIRPRRRWRWRRFVYPAFIGVGSAITEAAVDHHGFTWWRWLLAWTFTLLLPKFFTWVVRTFKSDSKRADAAERRAALADGLRPTEPADLEGEALEWAAYQVSIGLGLDTTGWVSPPSEMDEVRFEHGGGRENRWRGTITDIRINSDGIPQYRCIPRERRERYDHEPRVRWVTIDQMEPYK